MRPVKVDRIVETQALIAEGLTEGESVVLDGQSLLRPQAKVILSTPSGNPAAAAPPAPVPPS
jgi:multidrug efflux pump subunit AcrA (membrane-fusion protein)